MKRYMLGLFEYTREHKRETLLFGIIILLALAARVIYAMTVKAEQLYDFATYYQLAVNIANGAGHSLDGFANAWTGPGYPYALAAFFKLIGGASIAGAKLFNIICSMLTVALAWPVVIRLFKKTGVRSLAFALIALLPIHIAYVNVTGTEVFFSLLLMSLIFTQLYFSEKKWCFAPVGILCALLALTKPFMLAYPVICGCHYWIEHKKIKKTLIYTALTVICMAVVIAPWTIRNFRHFGRLIPVSYNMGYNMYVNDNASNTSGAWMDISAIEKTEEAAEKIEGYLANDRSIKNAHDAEPFLKEEAAKWVRANFGEYLKLGFLRLRQTFFSGANDIAQWARNGMYADQSAENIRRQNTIQFGYDAAAFLLNSAGMIFMIFYFWDYALSFFTKAKKIDALASVTFIGIAFFIVVTFFFEGQARYAFPSYVFMIFATVRFFEMFCEYRKGKTA